MSMADLYRTLADTYARHSADNPVQTHYDRPAVLGLVGDMRGKRVLELGCAAGVLTEQLVEAGADVLAVDREPRLVAHAAARLGGRAEITVADLEEPFDGVPTGSVDAVVASLVLHYLEDWAPLLAELHRLLLPGGVLVFSVHHPITGWNLSDRTDYHRIELVNEEWDWGGQHLKATMFRRPLSAVFGQLREAGFAVDVVDEPLPRDLPTNMDARMRVALTTTPVFLFIRAVREAIS
jgi:SAM-dependent methyltransferase